MPRLPGSFPHVLAVALAVVQLGCGGDGIVLPEEGDPANIGVVSGNEQSGPAGGTLPLPLVVRVTDSRSRPVENQDVLFTPGPGAGSVTATTVKTDAEGRASTSWTLGPATGSQLLEAKATGGAAPANLKTTFNAMAVAGAAAAIEPVSGDGQTGSVGSALPDSLVVLVTDAEGNPVAGIEVAWSASGGGSISPETVVTGSDGLAAAERVLGPGAGPQSAQASAPGLTGSPVAFAHNAVPANPTGLVKVSGDLQSAPAGFQLPDSLVVRLVDPNGNGVGGRAVTWVVGIGEGSVDPINSVTTPQGYAVTRWTMPGAAGDYSIDAVFSGLQPVPFSARATADVPTTLALESGDNQSATVGSQLPAPLRVKVTDENGNPVENVPVTWTANDGGSVSASTSGTNAQGIAEVTRTLGVVPRTYTTTAEVSGLQGSPVTFSSTATVGAPAKLAVTTQPSSTAQSGSPLAQPPVVQVQDALGNNVAAPGRTVTAGVGAGATLANASAVTDATGKATFTGLTITGPAGSSFNLTFTSSPLLPATSNAITLSVGAAAKLAVATAPSSPVPSGQVFPTQPRIQVQDAGGNPVAAPGHDVMVSISSGGGTLGGTPTVTTDANGLASFSGLSISGTAGPRTLQFTSTGLTAATATVTVGAAGAADVAINGGDGQTQTVNLVLETDPSVKVTDGSGNPVQGAAVKFTITSGGGALTGANKTTDAGGIATVGSWKLGTVAGSNTMKAVVAGVDSVTFTATATAGAPNAMVAVSPVTQSAVAGTEVADPPSVRVRDQFGNNVAGATVTFTVTAGGGSISPPAPASIATGSDGLATLTSWTLGPSAGVNNNGVRAALSGIAPVDFQASGTPGVPAKISINAGDGQHAPVGTAVAISPSVLVTDASDNPVQGVTVTFSPSGDGSVSSGTPTTDANGIATVGSWTLGSVAGVNNNTLTATATGTPGVSFTASADPPANSPPIGVGDGFSVPEDNTLSPDPGGGVLANDSDPDTDPLTAVLTGSPSHASSFTLNSDGSFSYQPSPDYFGPDGFTYRASDGKATSGVTAVSITVTPVNDPPGFTAGPDQSVSSLPGALLGVTVSPWAQNISPGPANEGQTVTFALTTDDDSAFLELPAVNPQGTLSFRPVIRADTTVVTVSIVAQDSEGGLSAPQTFTITITP